MSKFWKLLIVVVLFSVGSQLLAQEETTKQEVKKEVYRKDIPKQRPWVSDMRHKKIRMEHKKNFHMMIHLILHTNLFVSHIRYPRSLFWNIFSVHFFFYFLFSGFFLC